MAWDYDRLAQTVVEALPGKVSERDVIGAFDALADNGVPVKAGPALAPVVKAMLEFRDSTEPSEPTEHSSHTRYAQAPPDWRLYSHRIMESYRNEQQKILTVFSRAEPLSSWQDIAPLIEAMAGSQQKVGAWGRLPYPVSPAAGNDLSYWKETTVYSGVENPFGRDFLGRPQVDLSLPVAPLFRLIETARRIEAETGLQAFKAIAFLLADEPVTLPWIEVSMKLHGVERGMEVDVHIGTTEVKPEEVRAAYQRFLSEHALRISGIARFGARRSIEGKPLLYARRRTEDKTRAMVAYVDEYRRAKGISGNMPAGGWKDVRERFNTERGDECGTYGSDGSMRVQYSRATRGA
jgi:hypothetical protein